MESSSGDFREFNKFYSDGLSEHTPLISSRSSRSYILQYPPLPDNPARSFTLIDPYGNQHIDYRAIASWLGHHNLSRDFWSFWRRFYTVNTDEQALLGEDPRFKEYFDIWFSILKASEWIGLVRK